MNIGDRPRQYILDADGEPVPCDDLLAWARWMETGHRQLAQDRNEAHGPDGWRVSTVFLGLDHNYFGGPPLLWETMVFGGPLDGEQRRYCSREEALAGHQELCAQLNALSQQP